MQRLWVLGMAIAGLIAAAGCGSGGSGSSGPPAASQPPSGSSQAAGTTVSTAKIAGLGTVLVNGNGMTLYMFVPDAHAKVTCTGACAAVWPPLEATGGPPAAAGAAKASLLGSDPDPAGGNVVTYAGWPLYTYAADSKPGQATGQALNLNGGLWYVLSPAGKEITTKPAGGGAY
jgi:predicted lipoprotein with Yx(FWY)xxD motif